jgi:hypothetical protein
MFAPADLPKSLILRWWLTRLSLPTKNIENNPMQSSRQLPGTRCPEQPLTRRANQWHSSIVAQSDPASAQNENRLMAAKR